MYVLPQPLFDNLSPRPTRSPYPRPLSPLFIPFFLSSTNEAFPQMKQPIVWILARATKERVVERGKVVLSF